MFIYQPLKSSSTPSIAFNGSNASDLDNNMYISPTALLAAKIYAFGGLAFMIGVMLFALGLWIWTVIIKREWADSPPDLELHPERMREKEHARAERLKRQKEEKFRKRRDSDHKRFTPPPIRFNKKERRSTTFTSKFPNSSLTPSIKVYNPIERKTSFSVSPSKKGLRVSWASSAATLDADGHASEKSIDFKSETASLPSIKFPFETKSVVSSIDTLMPIPRARTSFPRLSASIAERAPRGEEMIATTTPDVCESWSKPTNPFLNCRCWDSIGPLDTRIFAGCNIHRYKD